MMDVLLDECGPRALPTTSSPAGRAVVVSREEQGTRKRQNRTLAARRRPPADGQTPTGAVVCIAA